MTTASQDRLDEIAEIVSLIPKTSTVNSFTVHIPSDIEFPLLGWGADRTVLDLLDGTVLKIQRLDDVCMGNQNEIEVQTWLAASPELKSHFAPVLDYASDLSWVIMPKVENVGQISDRDEYDLAVAIGQFGIDTSDYHKKNIGRLNGKWVVIDYGYEDDFLV